LSIACLAAGLRAQPGDLPRPRAVPEAAALAAARGPALARLADAALTRLDGEVWRVQHELLQAAQDARDDATRYVLMWEAVAVAERAGAPQQACTALLALEHALEIDREQQVVDLLRRMARDPAAPGTAVAVAALQHAAQAAARTDDAAMLGFFDLALRATVRGSDAWLHQSVVEELPMLRAAHAASVRLPRQAAGAAPEAWVRRSLRRAARNLIGDRWRGAPDDDARRAIGADLTALTGLLCDREGISRLRFRADGDLRQLVFSSGRWRIEDGVLVGAAEGTGNFATHRLAFAPIRSVVIRGGIRSPDGLNFRCKAGDVNLLLNWEVRPENHLWVRGECWPAGPWALVPGREHTIAMHATDSGVLVFVDGRHWWTAPGALAGTVCVYPALGSEIFVREILVDGELSPEGPVAGPRGVMK
jgi:hypothetical protein